jgi:hypothetical protein
VEVGWGVLYQESKVYQAKNRIKEKVQKAVLVTRKTELSKTLSIFNDILKKFI